MEIDMAALKAKAKAHRDSQPFGVSFEELPKDYPKKLPSQNMKSAVAFLLAWALANNATNTEFFERYASLLQNTKSRAKTPVELLEAMENKFFAKYLEEQPRQFLLGYYWPGWKHSYGVDFDKVFVSEYADPLLVKPGFLSTWHVPPTWAEYDKMAPTISQRHSEWVASKR